MTDIPIDTKNQPTRKQCLCCKKKFTPDPHVGQRQQYCSDRKCQSKRLRLTKEAWLQKAENKKFRKAQQSRWRKSHPDHLKQWRKKHPSSVRRNRERTRVRMRRRRSAKMFEKSIELRVQVARSKGFICTNRESTMILMRLKRGCGLSKAWGQGYAYKRIQSALLQMPQGQLYKVSGVP
jgi:hypothetical protein